ncbi:acetyl-CoA synthetase-like protein [Hygrophoropsis aurantiaca]|uniref:Acetyl-CoA synthetase-like protein n=1 Tax=Hygrophoropsis aurantiaca TaxID=72124 RepID=A0ACB8AHU5_9AGAM|nr:acetyl-CoA synthetase-like protein [Hygrophoropsis aurantiaca]
MSSPGTISNQRIYPPLDESVFLPDVIDFHILNNSTIPIYVFPDDDAPHGVTDISFLEFGRAAHRAAYALRRERKGPDGQVIALVANTDSLLYHAIVAGAIIAGLVPFAMSPRNTAPAIASMMKTTGCHRLFTIEHTHGPLIADIRHEIPNLEVDELPSFKQLYPKPGKEVAQDLFESYPPPALRPGRDEPALYLHSSGSTGYPKPIAHSHRIVIQWLAQRKGYIKSGITDESTRPQRLGAMSLPSFHSYGLAIQLYAALGGTLTVVLYPPTSVNNSSVQPVVPTPDNILDCLRKTNANILMTVPSLLEHWTASETAVSLLKSLDYVLYGGGPLPQKIGDALHAAGVPIATEYGGTEFGCPVLIPTKQDLADGEWIWMRFSDNVSIRWVPQGDNAYECHILSSNVVSMAVENLPDVKGYGTSDVFIRHPTKAGLWKLVGRTDDVLMLASGEKTVPAPMESIIGSSPFIKGVVMFGRERNQVGILVEPHDDHIVDTRNEGQLAQFKDKIWPWIEEANRMAPGYSRIFKDMILVTHQDKPMPRAGKGTVQKKSAVQLYGTDIDALYERIENDVDSANVPTNWSQEALQLWLEGCATRISANGGIDSSIDIFSQGMDSLSATYLRNRIIGTLRHSSDVGMQIITENIAPSFVFDNPTIIGMASRLASLIHNGEQTFPDDLNARHKASIEDMIEKYLIGMDCAPPNTQDNVIPARHTVVLTGSTGGLGSYLLAQLLRRESVSRVYAFNRPSKAGATSESRQRASFEDKGLPVELLKSEQLTFIEGHADQEQCGLEFSVYNKIRNSVTLIIHNSWRLDFNLSLSSFESNIHGTRNLIELARLSSYSNLRFLFTSSIASAQSWSRDKGPVPEEIEPDSAVAIGAGYGESKYVAERLVAKCGREATTFRIGQIAGGPNGAWATTDWYPIIVKSSLALGIFPDAQGYVSWMPAHRVADIIIDAAFAKDKLPATINIIHPRPVAWSTMMGQVRAEFVRMKGLDEHALRMVSFEDWLSELDKRIHTATKQDLDRIPALKLIEYFRKLARSNIEIRASGLMNVEVGGLAAFATDKAQSISPSMRELSPISKGEAEKWVRYWIDSGGF